MIKPINADTLLSKSLSGKQATFMLAISNTDTAEIDGISQAGIPGMLHLTPILDAEFLLSGEVYSMPDIAKTPKGVPSPALMTRAVHTLRPFGGIELLDLGLKLQPKLKETTIYSFGLKPSKSIAEGADIDARKVFDIGYSFGQKYKLKDDYLILAESVPSGTTTAAATALALGYDAYGLFSSSFKNGPSSIRKQTIDKALSHISPDNNLWNRLGLVSDNMLIFNAGFILGVNGRFPIVLAGGTQMAAVLLILDSIRKEFGLGFDRTSLMLHTTKWVAEDPNSDIKALLDMLDFAVEGAYADFDFGLSSHPILKLYDEGEAKEGVGAGGALVYGLSHGLSQEEIIRQVEAFLG